MTDAPSSEKAAIDAFDEVWDGGYFEGDPLDPMGPSTYGLMGYVSVLHAVYLACIKPYVDTSTTVLEIGPGRGAWTRCFVECGARRIWCVDAKTADANCFWEYVGRHESIRYVKVEDFSLRAVPDDSIDYFFSFGCFCHIAPPHVETYIGNLSKKLRSGARGFLMIADYDRVTEAVRRLDMLSFERVRESPAFKGHRLRLLRLCLAVLMKIWPLKRTHLRERPVGEADAPDARRWYHLGIDAACTMLEKHGFEVLDRDMGVVHRDPVVRFRKP